MFCNLAVKKHGAYIFWSDRGFGNNLIILLWMLYGFEHEMGTTLAKTFTFDCSWRFLKRQM